MWNFGGIYISSLSWNFKNKQKNRILIFEPEKSVSVYNLQLTGIESLCIIKDELREDKIWKLSNVFYGHIRHTTRYMGLGCMGKVFSSVIIMCVSKWAMQNWLMVKRVRNPHKITSFM